MCETVTHCATVYTYTHYRCLLMPVTIANEGVPFTVQPAIEADYVMVQVCLRLMVDGCMNK